MRRLFLYIIVVVFFSSSITMNASAVAIDFMDSHIEFYDPKDVSCIGAAATAPSGATTKDYAGREILNQDQLAAIAANQAAYQEAATASSIPWQMIAVIHLRESGLKRVNPGNGQGIYQFVNKNGGPYPTGPVDDAEFLRQTKLAAEFIKGKSSNPSKLAVGDESEVKDTFFGYNGRAAAYKDQAVRLGFNREQGYEGSPYVMNIADAPRDPAVSPTTWGQIKTDGGALSFPANSDHGAFITYGSLAGVTPNACANNNLSGPAAQRIVSVAEQELAFWESGQMKPGTDFHKYNQGQNDNWCAWFASWVYYKAGVPLTDTNNGSVSSVTAIQEIGMKNEKFTYTPVSNNMRPKVGDLAIQKNGVSHVNIVVAVAGDVITTIGGNQGGGGGQGSYFATSKVTRYTMKYNEPRISGYVSLKEGS